MTGGAYVAIIAVAVTTLMTDPTTDQVGWLGLFMALPVYANMDVPGWGILVTLPDHGLRVVLNETEVGFCVEQVVVVLFLELADVFRNIRVIFSRLTDLALPVVARAAKL